MFCNYLLTALLLHINIDPAHSSHSGNSDVLASKVHSLAALTTNSPILNLNYAQYVQYLREPPRNYSVFLMLTALASKRGCHGCQAANDEFNLLANSWSKSTPTTKNRVFFALADFDDHPQIFKSLNQNTVPIFIHFPAHNGPTPADFFDITRHGFAAETLARWIFSRASIEISITRPSSYAATAIITIFAALLAIILYLRPNSMEFVFQRSTLSYISMVSIFYTISGQVWNSIRHPPLLSPQQGGVTFFYPGGDFQFIFETIIVMATYILVSSSIVLLNEAGMTSDTSKQRMMAIGGLGMLTLFVSLVLSLFRKKYQSYPYSFLLK